MTRLQFNREPHTYTYDGVVVPSVTQVLPSPIVPTTHMQLDMEYARQRGQAVHLATELYDLGDLDEDSMDPVIVPYLDAWEKFLIDSDFHVSDIEARVYSERNRYAGTLDRSGTINGGKAILDIKAVHKLSPTTGLQTAAYEDAYRKDRRCKPARRFAVQLKPDGAYVMREYTDTSDLSVFLSYLQIHNWEQTYGID